MFDFLDFLVGAIVGIVLDIVYKKHKSGELRIMCEKVKKCQETPVQDEQIV